MDRSSLKFAAYLDQAAEDPIKAAEAVAKFNISNVVLRRAWGKVIAQMADGPCGTIKNILASYDLKPILLCTEIGYQPADTLMHYESQLIRVINLCSFFGCSHIRLGIGQKSADPRSVIVQEAWMRTIDRKCLEANVVPCLEISYDHVLNSPAEIASLLHKYKRWSIIYDPAVLIQKKRIDPFTRYWSLFRERVKFFDIHDHKVGLSPKLAGQGDAKLDLAMADAITSGYNGWYCLEHGMGRRVGNTSGLDNVFQLSVNAFDNLLKRLDLGNR